MKENEIDIEWSDVDGSGLVRVFTPNGFRAGLALVSMLADVAEQVGYEPEVMLTAHKLTVTIPDDASGRHYALAKAIDELFV